MKSESIILSTLALFLFMTTAHAGDGYGGGHIPSGAESTIVGASVDGKLMVKIDNGFYQHQGAINQHSQVIAHSQRFDNRRYDNRYNRSRSDFKNHDRNYYRNDHKRSFRNDHKRDFPRYRYNNKSNCRKIITIQKGYYGTRHVISTICDNNFRHKFQKTNPFKSYDRFRRY